MEWIILYATLVILGVFSPFIIMDIIEMLTIKENQNERRRDR